ncbi:Hypothetical predicted protein [Paramuricea clavata]|uniref:Uncharacterized protein n=1 Tax=Paramuricea clavata TaxID=317549 RepID=A0A7D9EM67_PARCT|nr:Hypothetical predicted protein [Paramuricea clavata]
MCRKGGFNLTSQVQHLTNEFWKRWRNEFLQNLQPRQKWTKEKRNFKEGDVVLLKDNDLPRNKWSLAKVLDTQTDEQGLVRAVSLRMPTGSTLDRPIDKLVLLLEAEERPGIPDKEPRDLNKFSNSYGHVVNIER